MSYTRFAIYYLPPEGALADFGSTWLGWDVARGRAAGQFELDGLEAITATPRKYGFHATLKPPFRLAAGRDAGELQGALQTFSKDCPSARSAGLELSSLGRFLALTPVGDPSDIDRVAERCVSDLDAFRAPAGEAELARRRKSGLSANQEQLLSRWGYPYVMEEFRFHMTLTGRLPDDQIAPWMATARAHMPRLPEPFVIDAIALVGERADGNFELVERYALAG